MARLSADDKLIKENPDASINDLLALGLSPEGHERLLKERGEDQPKETQKEQPQTQKASDQVNQPAQPTVQKQNVAMPKLQEAKPSDSGDMVTLVSPDGSETKMTRSAAERFTRGGRNANYQIK